MSLNLTILDTKTPAEAGMDLHLVDPRSGELLYDDQKEPCTVTILGSDSAKVRAFDRDVEKRAVDRARRRGAFDNDPEAKLEVRVNRAAIATLGWSDNMELDDAKLVFSEAEARRFYGDLRFLWVLEQLETAMEDRMRFFKSASGK